MSETSTSDTAAPPPSGGSPIDRLMAKPAEIKGWWAKLTEAFGECGRIPPAA